MTNRPDATWVHAEDNELRGAAASGETMVTISKRLCRSEKAIRHRAGKLGIEFVQQGRKSPSRPVELGLSKSMPTERLKAARAAVSSGAGAPKAKGK